MLQIFSLLSAPPAPKKQRVRFSNIMEVRQLPSTQALEAKLSRMSYLAAKDHEAMLRSVAKLTITDVAKISFFFCFVVSWRHLELQYLKKHIFNWGLLKFRFCNTGELCYLCLFCSGFWLTCHTRKPCQAHRLLLLTFCHLLQVSHCSFIVQTVFLYWQTQFFSLHVSF